MPLRAGLSLQRRYAGSGTAVTVPYSATGVSGQSLTRSDNEIMPQKLVQKHRDIIHPY